MCLIEISHQGYKVDFSLCCLLFLSLTSWCFSWPADIRNTIRLYNLTYDFDSAPGHCGTRYVLGARIPWNALNLVDPIWKIAHSVLELDTCAHLRKKITLKREININSCIIQTFGQSAFGLNQFRTMGLSYNIRNKIYLLYILTFLLFGHSQLLILQFSHVKQRREVIRNKRQAIENELAQANLLDNRLDVVCGRFDCSPSGSQ